MAATEIYEFSKQEIMAMERADELFSSQPKNVHAEYKRLAKRWHPDLSRGDVDVLTHVNVLHDEAERQIAAGVWYDRQPAPAAQTYRAPQQQQAHSEPVYAPVWPAQAAAPAMREPVDILSIIVLVVLAAVILGLLVSGHYIVSGVIVLGSILVKYVDGRMDAEGNIVR